MDSKKAGAAKARKAGKIRAGAEKKGSRLPYTERRAQILREASKLFSEHGLAAQTRMIAAACGISQRLLYRFFPTKEDLVNEVYQEAIAGRFQARWFMELSDRRRPMRDRLQKFYMEYLDTVMDKNWLRLFLFASLADVGMAPNYISSIVTKLLETIIDETALEFGIKTDIPPAAIHEFGWTLHGAISHYAIRRHIYGASQIMPQDKVVGMHVRAFLSGFEATVKEFEMIAA